MVRSYCECRKTAERWERAILVGRDAYTPAHAGGDRSIAFVAGAPSGAHGFGGCFSIHAPIAAAASP